MVESSLRWGRVRSSGSTRDPHLCVAKLLLFISERIDNLRPDSEGPRVPSYVARAEENAMMNMKMMLTASAVSAVSNLDGGAVIRTR